MFKHIYIEITNRCNLDCKFCAKTNRTAKDLKADEFRIIAQQLKGKSEYFYLHVLGEPLLNENIDSILSVCDEMNMKIKMTTNGTLLKQNLEKLIVHKSLKAVNISLTCISNFETEEKFKYLDNVFSISKILAQNKIAVTPRYWLGSDQNFELIKEAVYKEFGLRLSDDSGYQKIYDNLIFSKQEQFVWPAHSVNKNNDGQDGQTNEEKAYCLGLRKQLAILSDGVVVPCCIDSDGANTLGNIFNNSLEEILALPLSIAIAKGFSSGNAVTTLCRRCTYKEKFIRKV